MEEKRIGQLIKERREELGYSQVKLASLLEVNSGTVSRWESGKTQDIRRKQICLLSQYLCIPIDTILGLSEETSNGDIELVKKKLEIQSKIDQITDKSKLESIEKIIDALM